MHNAQPSPVFPLPNSFRNGRIFKAFDFCLPTKSTAVPDGPEWLHEIKYDGYRLRLERDGERVRLISRGGYNWTDRYPWNHGLSAEEPASPVRRRWRGGSAWGRWCGCFNALHSQKHDHEVQLYAFDIMALDGEDLRSLPLSMRKTNLARLLAGGHISCLSTV